MTATAETTAPLLPDRQAVSVKARQHRGGLSATLLARDPRAFGDLAVGRRLRHEHGEDPCSGILARPRTAAFDARRCCSLPTPPFRPSTMAQARTSPAVSESPPSTRHLS
jgi:hypothetical protein